MAMFPCILRPFPFKPGIDYARDHWHQGKDFIITFTGQHCSIRDIEILRRDFQSIAVQYDNNLYCGIDEL